MSEPPAQPPSRRPAIFRIFRAWESERHAESRAALKVNATKDINGLFASEISHAPNAHNTVHKRLVSEESQPQPRAPATIFMLPPELHIQILSNLASLSDQVSASEVCVLWRSLLLDTTSLRRRRYISPDVKRITGLHRFLDTRYSGFGCTIKDGKVLSWRLCNGHANTNFVRSDVDFSARGKIWKRTARSKLVFRDIAQCPFLDDPVFDSTFWGKGETKELRTESVALRTSSDPQTACADVTEDDLVFQINIHRMKVPAYNLVTWAEGWCKGSHGTIRRMAEEVARQTKLLPHMPFGFPPPVKETWELELEVSFGIGQTWDNRTAVIAVVQLTC
ncbi:hypothetical protein ABW19_dt0204937 [Dactylella cylindrospora]|nr:hypothetical protein ABW19_dt0204937 [Dactylella cylindrospora]